MSVFGKFYGSTQFGQQAAFMKIWCVKGITVNGTVECLEPESDSSSPDRRSAASTGGGPPTTPGVKIKIKFNWKVTCLCENTPIDPSTGLPDHPLGPDWRGNATVEKCGGFGSEGNKNVRNFTWHDELYEYECRDPDTPPGAIDSDPQAGMIGCDCFTEVDTGEEGPFGQPIWEFVPNKCYGTYEKTETITPFRVGDIYCDGSCEGWTLGNFYGDTVTIAALKACGAKKRDGTPDSYNIQNLEVADCMNKLICCPDSHGGTSNYLAQAWIKEVFNTIMGYRTFNRSKCLGEGHGSTPI